MQNQRIMVKGTLKAIARTSGSGDDSTVNQTIDYINRLEDLIHNMYIKSWPYLRDEGWLEDIERKMEDLGLMDEEE